MRFHPAAAHRPSRLDHPLLVLRSLAEILILAIFVFTFIAQPSHIPSASMWPTLRPGDMLLADNQSFAPEGRFAAILPPTTVRRGDIAIFHFPLDPHTDLVKRVLGLPGDRIQLRSGKLLINGQPVAEPYAFHSNTGADLFRDDFPTLHTLDPDVDPAWWATLRRLIHAGEVTVPAGHFFVLGDNRNDSEDSRYWGFVPQSSLVGRPLLVYLPAADVFNPPRTFLARLRSLAAGFRIVR